MSFYKIRPKAGTKEQWETANTVLAEREIGFEFPETGIGKGIVKMKMGDGKTTWKDLPYAQVVPLTQTDVLNVESTSVTKPPSAGYVKEKFDALNSALIKIKDIVVRNLNINIPDGNGFFALVKTLDEVIPERKDTVGATVVSFDSVPGVVVPYLHLNQEKPALYLYSNTEGVLDYMVIRISYI